MNPCGRLSKPLYLCCSWSHHKSTNRPLSSSFPCIIWHKRICSLTHDGQIRLSTCWCGKRTFNKVLFNVGKIRHPTGDRRIEVLAQISTKMSCTLKSTYWSCSYLVTILTPSSLSFPPSAWPSNQSSYIGETCHGLYEGVWTHESHIGSMNFLCVVYIDLDSSTSMTNFWADFQVLGQWYQSSIMSSNLHYHLQCMSTYSGLSYHLRSMYTYSTWKSSRKRGDLSESHIGSMDFPLCDLYRFRFSNFNG